MWDIEVSCNLDSWCLRAIYLRLYNHSYHLLTSSYLWVEYIKLSLYCLYSRMSYFTACGQNTEYLCVLFALGYLTPPISSIIEKLKNSDGSRRMKRKAKQDNQSPELLTSVFTTFSV